jgi:hypothetical protein
MCFERGTEKSLTYMNLLGEREGESEGEGNVIVEEAEIIRNFYALNVPGKLFANVALSHYLKSSAFFYGFTLEKMTALQVHYG